MNYGYCMTYGYVVMLSKLHKKEWIVMDSVDLHCLNESIVAEHITREEQ